MENFFALEGHNYNLNHLSDEGRIAYEKLIFVHHMSRELTAEHAVLTRAKNAYIEDIKEEIVQNKSGVDFTSLFQDD